MRLWIGFHIHWFLLDNQNLVLHRPHLKWWCTELGKTVPTTKVWILGIIQSIPFSASITKVYMIRLGLSYGTPYLLWSLVFKQWDTTGKHTKSAQTAFVRTVDTRCLNIACWDIVPCKLIWNLDDELYNMGHHVCEIIQSKSFIFQMSVSRNFSLVTISIKLRQMTWNQSIRRKPIMIWLWKRYLENRLWFSRGSITSMLSHDCSIRII